MDWVNEPHVTKRTKLRRKQICRSKKINERATPAASHFWN
jgi:hypothetical protein